MITKNDSKIRLPLSMAFIIGFLCLSAGAVPAFETSPSGMPAPLLQESGELYLPSDNVPGDVSSALEAARENNKRVLIIMGANWCHDSRALASRMYQEPLRALIDEHYEPVFVDVGYLDISQEVVRSIGVPVYFATPTVLILDPISGRMVNADNRHQWGDAYNISMQDSVEYFRLMADSHPPPVNGGSVASADLQQLLDEIEVFQDVQAKRLYAAYAVIGPMLKAYKDGNTPELFEDRWNEVGDFRMSIPADIAALRADAYARVAAGESGIKLKYPQYPAFSWENQAL